MTPTETLDPQTMEEVTAEIREYGADDEYAKLDGYRTALASLAAKELLEGNVGRATGWAELYVEADMVIHEMMGRHTAENRALIRELRDQRAAREAAATEPVGA